MLNFKDGNGSWPDLFNQLQAALTSENETSKHHAALTLKELIKMMKSKRLPADRKAFYTVAESMWPIAINLWSGVSLMSLCLEIN